MKCIILIGLCVVVAIKNRVSIKELYWVCRLKLRRCICKKGCGKQQKLQNSEEKHGS